MERHIPGRGGKAPVIVAAAIALTGFAALIPSCLGEFFCFQQLVQRFFYAASNQFLNLTLDYFLVELYNVVGHGLPSPFECLCSNFILPETRRPCLLFCRLQFAQFYYTLSFTASRFACFTRQNQSHLRRHCRYGILPPSMITALCFRIVSFFCNNSCKKRNVACF